METIGFIGTGVMGKSMAGHLLKAGYPLLVYSRTKSKAEDLIQAGAQWEDSAGSLAAKADVVISIVSMPVDVETIYLGQNGIIANVRPGSVVVDMTTSTPELAKRIAEAVAAKGAAALDAPVSGGDKGAREGTLSIMVGGAKEAFDRVLPIFSCMGKNIVYQGVAGAGQHCKICNQIGVAMSMIGVCEALTYAEKSGLKPEAVLQSISAGAAGSWSLTNLAPRILSGDFAPGFFVKHLVKDIRIAIDSAAVTGAELPGLRLAQQLYERLADQGHADEGTQALYKLYADQKNS